MLIYTAEPGSPSQGALNLLDSWTATDRGSRIGRLWSTPPTPSEAGARRRS